MAVERIAIENIKNIEKNARATFFMVSMLSMAKIEGANAMKDEYEIYLRPLREEDAKMS